MKEPVNEDKKGGYLSWVYKDEQHSQELAVGREMPSKPRGQVCKGMATTNRTMYSGNCEQDIYSAFRLSRVWLFVASRTIVCQIPLSMGLSRQEYWSGLPFPPSQLGDHTPVFCVSCTAGGFFTTWAIGERFSKQDISCHKFCRGHSALSSVRAGKRPCLLGFGKSLDRETGKAFKQDSKYSWTWSFRKIILIPV